MVQFCVLILHGILLWADINRDCNIFFVDLFYHAQNDMIKNFYLDNIVRQCQIKNI